jgi:hypothetical protein
MSSGSPCNVEPAFDLPLEERCAEKIEFDDGGRNADEAFAQAIGQMSMKVAGENSDCMERTSQ